jgi:hypothetical protein
MLIHGGMVQEYEHHQHFNPVSEHLFKHLLMVAQYLSMSAIASHNHLLMNFVGKWTTRIPSVARIFGIGIRRGEAIFEDQYMRLSF